MFFFTFASSTVDRIFWPQSEVYNVLKKKGAKGKETNNSKVLSNTELSKL
jgi:hypothetical protein